MTVSMNSRVKCQSSSPKSVMKILAITVCMLEKKDLKSTIYSISY